MERRPKAGFTSGSRSYNVRIFKLQVSTWKYKDVFVCVAVKVTAYQDWKLNKQRVERCV